MTSSSLRPPDLAALTARLVDVPSVSGDEGALANLIADELKAQCPPCDLVRLGNNLVLRGPHRPERPTIVLAGHLDTVPPAGNEKARPRDGRLYGLGSSDMKSGLAVMIALARTVDWIHARANLTFVFYECEEVSLEKNGLRKIFPEQPHLATADLAILLEPTNNALELGCLGTLNAKITARGRAAHSARPWLGENAIAKAVPFLARFAALAPRPVIVGGVEFLETFQVTMAEGGRARNVIPDSFAMNINFRFAPTRTAAEAVAELRSMVPAGFDFEIVDVAPPGVVRSDHPLIEDLLGRFALERRGKQAWTDVAQFSERGVAAVNFGPGVPEQAHQADEFVPLENLGRAYAVLHAFVSGAPEARAEGGRGRSA
ncbi:MAG: succinyl-diaminopimelate desuccinylase [Candidatus Eisenbacteria bacterium]